MPNASIQQLLLLFLLLSLLFFSFSNRIQIHSVALMSQLSSCSDITHCHVIVFAQVIIEFQFMPFSFYIVMQMIIKSSKALSFFFILQYKYSYKGTRNDRNTYRCKIIIKGKKLRCENFPLVLNTHTHTTSKDFPRPVSLAIRMN